MARHGLEAPTGRQYFRPVGAFHSVPHLNSRGLRRLAIDCRRVAAVCTAVLIVVALVPLARGAETKLIADAGASAPKAERPRGQLGAVQFRRPA